MARYNSIIDTVGRTPVVRINKLAPEGVNLWVKVEAFNPLGSVKDRLALGVIEAAEKSGELKPGQTVVEMTSGNTGIGLAMVCAAKGYPLVIVMPESFSVERRKLMRFLGAKVLLTPAAQRATGAINKAIELSKAHGWFLTRQFENPANPLAHERTTGPEIWEALAGQVDVVVAGIGTGGTLSGLGRFFRAQGRAVEMVAVEPASLPALTRHLAGEPLQPAGSLIQGIGPGFVPKNLDLSVVGRVETVKDRDAIVMARRLAREEGLLCGISCGAAAAAVARLAADPAYAGKTIVVILPDAGDRYVSTVLYSELFEDKKTAAL